MKCAPVGKSQSRTTTQAIGDDSSFRAGALNIKGRYIIHVNLHVRDRKKKYYYQASGNYEGDKEVGQALFVAIEKCIKKQGIKKYIPPRRVRMDGQKMNPYSKPRRSSGV